ncbi:uncharacterized protein LOC144143293 [Haemaphysalis longicornis]
MGNDQSCLTALDLALPGAATAFQPADMRNATGVITGATIDWSVACTASETRMCHVAKRPSTWNEFLYPLNLRLRDWSGSCGQLCLESFDDFVGEASAEILHQALTVLHLLLKTHRCVSAVDIYDDILKHPHTRKEWFLVLDTARRNSSIVLRAAQFVTGLRSDRGGAEAVEDVFLYPELLEGLAEELSLPTIEAAALVRRGLQCLQSLDDFMRLAGVVKERVVCHRRGDGCLQLTDLGPDCWAVIRRYLLLCDIVDSII